MLNVLVTGAAGLIGGEVCARLHAAGHKVTALIHRNRTVRGNDGCEIPVPKIASVDVAMPRFGLTKDSWSRLAWENDLLIHCAAVTRFNLPSSRYRATNIGGTANAVALARAGNLGLIHVSTAYVCGSRDGTILESDPLPDAGFANAYENSKAAAERLVLASGAPFSIVRPSIVVGDSGTGAIRDFDTVYAVFKAIAEGHIRKIPCRQRATLDIVPIDHVAASIVTLAQRFEQAAGLCLHLVSGQPLSVAEFGEVIGSFAQLHRPDMVPAEQFDPEQLPMCERRLHKRLAAPYSSYFQRDPRFDDSVLRGLIGKACPPMGRDGLRRLILYCITQGFLPESRLSECRDSAVPGVCAHPAPTLPPL